MSAETDSENHSKAHYFSQLRYMDVPPVAKHAEDTRATKDNETPQKIQINSIIRPHPPIYLSMSSAALR
jgi:hypothetical protein